jgi:hypothetical protein
MIRASVSEPSGPVSLRGRVRLWPLGVGVVLALLGLTACVAPKSQNVSRPALDAETREAVADGVRLYESGEYTMAADRFAAGASLAERMGDLPLAWRATAAECASWLFARQLRDFDDCGLRLESIQRRNHEASGGTNALIAMGAVAGGRATPAVNIPRAVRRVMRPAPEGLR